MDVLVMTTGSDHGSETIVQGFSRVLRCIWTANCNHGAQGRDMPTDTGKNSDLFGMNIQ